MTDPRTRLLPLLLVLAFCAAAPLPGAAADESSSRVATCFGTAGTIWAAPPAWTYGTPGDDVIIGSAGNDVIWGRGGHDLICGNGGNDMLFGGGGRDRIQGGPGADILYGEAGADTLLGGPGGNILNGGNQNDRCFSGDAYVSCELPSVDKVLAACPTKREIARVDAEFDLMFDADPTAGTFACTTAGGSANLSPLQKRAYNAVRLMGRIPFDAALPWTPYTLEDWFAQRVDTIRFRSDITYSYFGPAGVVNILTLAPLPAGQATDRFIASGSVVGLGDLMVLLVHEARHADLPHNCGDGTSDTTLAYGGAWAVQYHLHLWLADHTAQAFLRPAAGDPASYQNQHRQDATYVYQGRFCEEP